MTTRNFNVKNGLTAGNITLDASTNTATTSNLVVTGNANFTTAANVALGPNTNVHITGGSSGQYLQTDGAGNLSWQTVSVSVASISNGTSNVNIPAASGNIQVSVAGVANVITFTSNNAYRGAYDLTGMVYQANTAPSSPQAGDQWYNTFNGILFEYLNDGTNSQWVDVSSIPFPNVTVANATAVQTNTSTATTVYPTFVTATTNANYSLNVVSGISANLSNNSITATTFVGALSGAATSATSATNASALLQNTSTATTVYPTFTTSSANGNSSAVINTSISANLSNASITATTFVGALSGAATSATTAGTVTTAAQPNITSVGTLTSLAVTGNTTSGNFVGVFANGNSNVNIPAANGNVNISAVGNANVLVVTGTGVNVAGTFSSGTGNANVGNIGAGNVEATNVNSSAVIIAIGNVRGGNINTAGKVVASTIESNVATGTAPLVVTSTTQVANLSVATAGSATTAGTVTTAAQPNITSVGTLTSLAVTGNTTSNNFVASNVNLVTANTITIPNGTAVAYASQQGGRTYLSYDMNTFPSLYESRFVNLATSTNVPTGAGTGTGYWFGMGAGDVANRGFDLLGTFANTFFFRAHDNGNSAWVQLVSNVSGTAVSATTAGTVTTAAQPNITSVGTLTSLTVSGSANFATSSGNVGIGTSSPTYKLVVSNAGAAGLEFNPTGGINSGTFIQAYNRGTSAYLDLTTYSANVFWSNGGATNMTLLTTGNVGIGNTAPTDKLSVNGAANVTGNVTGANIISTTNHIFSVATGISAAGTTQGTATAISKDFNVVSTVLSGNGVSLPTAVAGMRITVINTSANALSVYPLGNGIINTAAANAAYSQPAGARLDYICTAAATAPGGQWYTLNATYG